MENVRVVLPKKINLVLGDTFQMFFKSIIDAPNPYNYSVFVLCDKGGKNETRYFEFCPDEEGEVEIHVYVYSAGKVLVAEGKTTLCVHKPVSPKKPINILVIGDSLTGGGEWLKEAKRRLTETGGSPCGDGLVNINFIGDQKPNGANCEAYGGWRWDHFTSPDIKTGMWVNCSHSKTALDQHSLWKDDNGNIWQLESFELADFIKFNRYMHDAPYPEGGKLTHYKNAVDKEDIKINFVSIERQSPFLDPETKKIDFKKYCERNGYDGIDLVYISLGGNGIHERPTPEDHVIWNVENGKILVDLIHESYPDAKVIVAVGPGPSVTGGLGSNYGAILPFCHIYGMTKFHFDLGAAYEKWSEEEKYNDYVFHVNTGCQFDVEYGYPGRQKPVNLRSTETEFVGTNGSHPKYEGYMQLADAFYRDIVGRIKQFDF